MNLKELFAVTVADYAHGKERTPLALKDQAHKSLNAMLELLAAVQSSKNEFEQHPDFSALTPVLPRSCIYDEQKRLLPGLEPSATEPLYTWFWNSGLLSFMSIT